MKDEYLNHCLSLIKDESILWVLLIGTTADIVPQVVSIAEAVKRKWYKQTGEELKQFIDDSGPSQATLADGTKCEHLLRLSSFARHG